MTVELKIYYPASQKKMWLVPISGSKSFEEYWKPISGLLKLKLIPNFDLGLNLGKEDIPAVIAELDTFEDFVHSEQQKIIPPDKLEYVLSSLHELVEALKEAKNEIGEIDLWFN
ncbi:MAG: hypothetical protein ABI947_02280 [Chloroflexota bacterium]